ncbi:hypothetical protein GJAV_G00072050 [Gymnothorax javanicus]|nr:hypothetical protein GJAV_G00072050 [Gymnothorax javanicus]
MSTTLTVEDIKTEPVMDSTNYSEVESGSSFIKSEDMEESIDEENVYRMSREDELILSNMKEEEEDGERQIEDVWREDRVKNEEICNFEWGQEELGEQFLKSNQTERWLSEEGIPEEEESSLSPATSRLLKQARVPSPGSPALSSIKGTDSSSSNAGDDICTSGAGSGDDVTTDHETEAVQENQRKCTTKRRRNPDGWKKNVRKMKRASGQSYKSDTTGQRVAEKTVNVCDCSKCRLRCKDKLSEERRAEIFQEFYSLKDWSAQTTYIATAVLVTSPRRRTVVDPQNSRKQHSRAYYLSTKGGRDELKSVRVCKKMFLATLDINSARVDYAMKKKTAGELIDHRGKHVPGNKTPKTT